MPALRELDVRTLPPPQRHAEIFGLYAALKANEAFVLINDHYPKPLLYQFQAEFPGQFEWSALESGPDRFRVEIRRRGVGGARNVSEYLGGDHRRLDALMGEVEQLLEARSFALAGARFAEFACGLNRHIDVEEGVLFPAFEKMTGAVSGPTTVMRSEHVDIRALMGRVGEALKAEDAPSAQQSIRRLVEVLSGHNMKEEGILYPMTDQSAGDARNRDDLVKQLQAF